MRMFMTFGQKYRHEPHPTLPPDIAHPDGYIELVAKPGESVDGVLQAIFPGYTSNGAYFPYAGLYVGETPNKAFGKALAYFPRGLAAVATIAGVRRVV